MIGAEKSYCRPLSGVEPLCQAMSEFKFTCPVCGQHIAADSSATGAQIECPTCFQKIIVPQAPRADSKYILSATQYIKPPAIPPLPASPGGEVKSRNVLAPALFALVLFICVGGVAIYVLHGKNSRPDAPQTPANSANPAESPSPHKAWSLNLATAAYPDEAAAGKIHDKDFNCQRAVLQNGSLALRQGPGYPPDVGVNVYLPANDAQELDGKLFNIGSNQSGAAPRIVLRWREADLQVAQTFTNGYAMKLEFGPVAAEKIPGKIYLCLPDFSKSFVAGTFSAEIRKPAPPGPR